MADAKREVIFAPEGPPPGGAYSQAVKVGHMVWTAGIGPQKGPNGKFLNHGDIAAQTTEVLDGLQKILRAAGTSLANAVKVSAFIDDIDNWPAFNAAYMKFFPSHPPARTTSSVKNFPQGMCVEIDVVAFVP